MKLKYIYSFIVISTLNKTASKKEPYSKSNMVPPPIVKTGKRDRMDLDTNQTKPAKVAKVAKVANENEKISIMSPEVIPLLPVQDSLLNVEEKIIDVEGKKRRDAEVKKLGTDHHDLTTRLNQEPLKHNGSPLTNSSPHNSTTPPPLHSTHSASNQSALNSHNQLSAHHHSHYKLLLQLQLRTLPSPHLWP